MNCADLDHQLTHSPGYRLTSQDLQHLGQCKHCMEKYGFPHLFSLLSETQPIEVPSSPGESQFFDTLEKLGETQNNTFERAQFLNQTVQKGDCLFWRGEYSKAAAKYREALMAVQDVQSRVALQNKLARVEIHRQHSQESIRLLLEALVSLEETPPPQAFLSLANLREELSYWLLQIRYFLAKQWPDWFPLTTQFGDRSRAAQHLYRELSTLAQENQPALGEWAMWRELQWATKLQQSLEQVVSFGRRAVLCAQEQQHWRAQYWLRRVERIAQQEKDPIVLASADFYQGRCSFLLGRWDAARLHLERCVELSQSARDAYLRDAALQHLIRVYRNDGNFAQAVRVAEELLTLAHRLGNLPRLSASCRHFALIYAAYGDLRQAKDWADKALHIAEEDTGSTQEQSLSRMRCFVLLGDIEYRRGRKEEARLYLGEAIRIQREQKLPLTYLRDGVILLRKILGQEQPVSRRSWWKQLVRWLASRWAVLSGDLEHAHHLQNETTRYPSQEHQIPPELAYLYQEYAGEERPGGLREAIPASRFAFAFLSGQVPSRPEQPAFDREADQLAAMFPVGAVSSRWGRGVLARDRSGAITAQISNGADAPWGYFFADDIS